MDADGVWAERPSRDSDDYASWFRWTPGATITGGNPATNNAVRTRANNAHHRRRPARKVDRAAPSRPRRMTWSPTSEVLTGATVTLSGGGLSLHRRRNHLVRHDNDLTNSQR